MCQLICKHVSWFLETDSVLYEHTYVRKYVHFFIFFKKLGIPFCTAPVPVPYGSNLPEDVRNRGTLIRNVVYHEVFRDEF